MLQLTWYPWYVCGDSLYLGLRNGAASWSSISGCVCCKHFSFSCYMSSCSVSVGGGLDAGLTGPSFFCNGTGSSARNGRRYLALLSSGQAILIEWWIRESSFYVNNMGGQKANATYVQVDNSFFYLPAQNSCSSYHGSLGFGWKRNESWSVCFKSSAISLPFCWAQNNENSTKTCTCVRGRLVEMKTNGRTNAVNLSGSLQY